MLDQFSDQQINAYNNSDARINLFEGSVRSGKSFIANLRFLRELKEGPKGEYIICGKSERTVAHNIIEPLQALTGGLVTYNRGLGEIKLFGRKIYIVGANDERAEGKIRGATYAGALVDEISILPESFFRMLLSRLSIKDAKLFGTTNPDSPYHWLKEDFIDRQDEVDLKVFTFRLDDNPSLDPKYVKALKAEYTGLWHRRFIEGEWCLAEGSIFSFFDRNIHTIREAPNYAKKWFLGIDYGTENPFAAILVGYNSDNRPALWVEKEYYWDSKRMGYQKTDSEYATDILREFSGYPLSMIYVDPSAASFELELRRKGVSVCPANNDVLDGIRFMSSCFTNGDLKIKSDCFNLIKEIEGYVWDAKKSKLGIDAPLKTRDHACVTADTEVLTVAGYIPIQDVCRDEIINYDIDNHHVELDGNTFAKLTRSKAEIYELELENGIKLKATGDHEVLTERGYVEIRNLLSKDIVLCYI